MSMVKAFISYYKPHWKLFSIDMLCAFLVACCDLVYPMIAKDIVNVYVPDRNLRLVIVWAIVLLIIYVAKALLNFVIQYWGHIVGVRMQGDMRRDMFKHLQKLPFAFFDENKTGTLMSRMINDLQEVSELAHHGPENIFRSLIMRDMRVPVLFSSKKAKGSFCKCRNISRRISPCIRTPTMWPQYCTTKFSRHFAT